MSIDDPAELAALRAAGRVVAETLRELARRVRPGVTTGELDRVAADIFARHGARSGPQLDYDFPGAICISLDDECVHGIPGPRRLREGQLVKLDVTAELDGFYADACRTVAVGRVRPREQRLAAAAQSALRKGLDAARAGANVGAIGAAVQAEVERRGFNVCAELTGHGIGRRIHEEPSVPNVAWDGPELTDGLVTASRPPAATSSRRRPRQDAASGTTAATVTHRDAPSGAAPTAGGARSSVRSEPDGGAARVADEAARRRRPPELASRDGLRRTPARGTSELVSTAPNGSCGSRCGARSRAPGAARAARGRGAARRSGRP